MRFENRLTINAPIERVWELTAQVENWPAVTPTITSVELLGDGELQPGSRVLIGQPSRKPAIWTVTKVDGPRIFEWETRTAGVTMTAAHLLREVDGGCENIVSIELSGFGAGLIGRLAASKIKATIATENASFKKHAEQ